MISDRLENPSLTSSERKPSVWERSAWPWQDNAAAALPHYGLAPDCRLELLSLSENATYKVTDPRSGEARVLRLHRPGYRSLEAIRSELLWIEAVRQQTNVASPAIVPTLAGDAVSTFGGHHGAQHAVLFAFVSGAAPEETRYEEGFKRLGAITATLHRHALGWTPPPHFVRPTWDVEGAIGVEGHWGCWKDNEDVTPSAHRVISAADAKIRTSIDAYGRPPGRWGLIHGDMRLANLLVDGDEIQVIDYDDCGFSWHLYDLACALTFVEQRDDVDALVAAWLEGYRPSVPLDRADFEIIPAMVMLRRLLIAGWFSTHGHSEEAQALRKDYITDTVRIAELYVSGQYLRRAIA